jgi:hypothetical protein
LLADCRAQQKSWAHVITISLDLADENKDKDIVGRIVELVDRQQVAPIWMAENKVHHIEILLSWRYNGCCSLLTHFAYTA